MPVIKVKRNGVWEEIGSDASTLGGMKPDEFATASDLGDVRNLIDTHTHDEFITLDPTLSTSDMAADAKAVGDALVLKADKSSFDALSNLVGDTSVLEQIENALSDFSVDASAVQVDETGKRLNEALEEMRSASYPIIEATSAILEPDQYYVFGTVDSLAVTLQNIDDGYTHEHCFEFTAADEFYGMSITPEPKWVDEPSIESNKIYQVSILRGIGVIIGA